MTRSWPVRLTDGDLVVRPLSTADGRAWMEVRRRNHDWLSQWDATNPPNSGEQPPTFRQMVRLLRNEARAGRTMAFAVLVGGNFAGQVTLGGMGWGSLRSGYIGYWIDEMYAGRGYMPRAVAMVADYAFFTLGLHRIEINVRPENAASIRVVEKLGFRHEGLRRRYLHIAGDWRDHSTYALCAEEVPDGVLTAVKERSRNPR